MCAAAGLGDDTLGVDTLGWFASTGGNGGLVGGAVGAFAAGAFAYSAYRTRKWWTRAFR
jgi:hypothetical protein